MFRGPSFNKTIFSCVAESYSVGICDRLELVNYVFYSSASGPDDPVLISSFYCEKFGWDLFNSCRPMGLYKPEVEGGVCTSVRAFCMDEATNGIVHSVLISRQLWCYFGFCIYSVGLPMIVHGFSSFR